MLMQPIVRAVPAGAVPADAVPAAVPLPAAIEFDNVSLAFGGEAGPMLALDGVSFTAPQGQITTVVGPSGCGKTDSSQARRRMAQAIGRPHALSGP